MRELGFRTWVGDHFVYMELRPNGAKWSEFFEEGDA